MRKLPPEFQVTLDDTRALQISCPDDRCAVPAGWSCVYIAPGKGSSLGLPRKVFPGYHSTHALRREARENGPRWMKANDLHFTECYMRMFPDDPDAYCTCMDWSPEI